jgi:tyrosyl-tRNA synthetase
MGLAELLSLMRTTTLAQLLERDDFSQRWKAKQPISMLELMYPLLQGYDSVAISADVELGGTDQKFNLLLGRDIQRAYGQEAQAIMTMPILPGLDGHRKMSKSLANHIAITDAPGEMYGKAMSIPDETMAQYYALLLDEDLPTDLRPRDAKRLLAYELVRWLHGEREADEAEQAFDEVFVQREQPVEMEEALLGAEAVHLPALMADALAISRSEARRLIDQGAVSVDGAILAAGAYDHRAEDLDGKVLQVGRRRFRRMRAA